MSNQHWDRLQGRTMQKWSVRHTLWIAAVMAIAPWARADDAQPQPADALWAAHVSGILAEHCQKCHGEEKQRNGLDLRSLESIKTGGKGGPAVVPGSPKDSLLYQVLMPDADPHMPPKGDPLSGEQVAIIGKWIERLPAEPKPEEHASPAAKAEAPLAPAPPKPLEDLLPTGLNPTLVIDLLIERGWKQRDVTPSAPCDDRTFVRRLYLDLAGRVPTVAEIDAFLARTESDKRARLVEQLLDSNDYARHMREVFDVVLMGRGDDRDMNDRRQHGWHDYLERVFRDNQPWDMTVRSLLLARAESDEDRPADWFVFERKDNHQQLAEAIGPSVFGTQIQCAQCHDHPLAHEIKQAHYWGLVAIYGNSRNVRTDKGPQVAELADDKPLKYSDIKGNSYEAQLVFLDDRGIDRAALTEPTDGQAATGPYLVEPKMDGDKVRSMAIPRFSRRLQFVEQVVAANPRVSEAFVNRMWALLMGRGIVHPVDRMDSTHSPSHPQLLSWLGRDFADSGYDVKRLVRSIVSSRAYQLDSRPAPTAGLPAPPDAFAYALDKPLTAETYYRSMMLATRRSLEEPDPALLGGLRGLFPDVMSEHVITRLNQATFLTNNWKMQDLVTPKPGSTTEHLLTLPSPRERVEHAFMSVLGRMPDEVELAESVNYLEARSDRPQAAVEQLVWALLTGAEFRFNH